MIATKPARAGAKLYKVLVGTLVGDGRSVSADSPEPIVDWLSEDEAASLLADGVIEPFSTEATSA